MSDVTNKDSYPSPFNSLDELVAKRNIPDEITFTDCTLRDGEQQAGVVFTKEDKVRIAQALDDMGIHEIETGMPAVSQEDEEATRSIAKLGLKANLTALARAVESDIDKVASLGVSGVSISLPIGDLQREYKLGWSNQKFIDTFLRVGEHARKSGLYVILSPYDNTRVNIDFLREFLEVVKNSGYVDRVRLVDTVGAALPAAVAWLTREMRSILGKIPIEVHCHDDFGLGTANTLAAVEAGASVVSGTVTGLGERCGNTPLEEVAMALRILYGVDPKLNLDKLLRTARVIEELSGVSLQPHKAVVGRNSFRHESGMVVDGILKMSFTGEPYRPELVGQSRQILVGKKSGVRSLQYRLQELGIDVEDDELRDLLEQVKEFAIKNKSALTDDDIRQLVMSRREAS